MKNSAAKSKLKLDHRHKITAISFAALALGAQGLRADTLDYNGGTGNYAGGFTDVTPNGTSGTTPTVNDDAVFNISSNNAVAETITLVTGATANSFTFTNTGTTGFTGGTLTLGGGTSNTGTAAGLTVNSGAGAVTIGEALTIGATETFTNSSTNAVAINTSIAGAANVGTTANPEVLTLSTGSFTQNTTSSFSNGTGGVLALVISNNGSYNDSKGGAVTYSGGTTVLSGFAGVNNGAGLGTGTITIGDTTVTNAATAATVRITANGTTSNNYVIQGGGTESLQEGGSNDILTVTGTVTLNNTVPLILTTSASSTNPAPSETFSNVISGTGGIAVTQNNRNTFILNLNGANTYSGGTTLNFGTTNINNGGTSSANSAIGTGTLTINGGTIDNTTSSAITLATNNAVTIGGNFTFTGTSALNLGTGAVSLTGTRTITTSSTTNALTIGGVISGTATTYGLTKSGAGILVLGGANTYTGPTVISASGGTLNAAAASALATTSMITVNSGATLSLTANNALGPGATANAAGSTTSIAGTVPITMSGGTLTVAGGVSQGNGSTSTVGIGLLTLTTGTTSVISFGTTGSSTLSFSALTAPTATSLLNVLNDNNTTGMAGVDGSTDRLIFNEALSAAQLADIEFNGVTGSANEISLGNGDYEILSAVPEPSTWVAGCLSLGMVGFAMHKRRRAANPNGLGSMAA